MNDMTPGSPPNIHDLVGTWRRFGPVGPVYEIVGDARPDGDSLMRMRVLEISEEVDYRLIDVLDDPRGAVMSAIVVPSSRNTSALVARYPS